MQEKKLKNLTNLSEQAPFSKKENPWRKFSKIITPLIRVIAKMGMIVSMIFGQSAPSSAALPNDLSHSGSSGLAQVEISQQINKNQDDVLVSDDDSPVTTDIGTMINFRFSRDPSTTAEDAFLLRCDFGKGDSLEIPLSSLRGDIYDRVTRAQVITASDAFCQLQGSSAIAGVLEADLNDIVVSSPEKQYLPFIIKGS